MIWECTRHSTWGSIVSPLTHQEHQTILHHQKYLVSYDLNQIGLSDNSGIALVHVDLGHHYKCVTVMAKRTLRERLSLYTDIKLKPASL